MRSCGSLGRIVRARLCFDVLTVFEQSYAMESLTNELYSKAKAIVDEVVGSPIPVPETG